MPKGHKNSKPGHASAAKSAKEPARKTKRLDNLAEFFAKSPLRDSELDVKRRSDCPRKLDL
jgi:hypothetical protein